MTSRTERILIIDADEKARTDLARYLEARGFYVTGYPDLASAKALFDDNIPDIIFADLSPEVIRDLANRLEEAETFTPIVLVQWFQYRCGRRLAGRRGGFRPEALQRRQGRSG